MPNPFRGILNFLGGLLPGKGQQTGPVPQAIAEEDFLHWGGHYNTPRSSNVSGFQYDAEQLKLTVQYRGVAFYEYSGVSEQEAFSAFIATSSGRWVWDSLRVRGTRCSHRKDYVFLPGPSSWQPKNPCPANAALFPAASLPGATAPPGFLTQVFGTSPPRKKRRRR